MAIVIKTSKTTKLSQAYAVLVILLLSSSVRAQVSCSSGDTLVAASAFSATTPRGVIIIPVVFHVFFHDAIGHTSQDIPDSRILSQLNVLNEDFRRYANTPGSNTNPVGADCRIEFRLASLDPLGQPTNGILRDTVANEFFDSEELGFKYDSAGGSSAWDSRKYLNIWVGDFEVGLRGRAQFPALAGVEGDPISNDTYGIAITENSFGDDGGTNLASILGRTATHEVGHYLGLFHTFRRDDGVPCDSAMSDCATHGDMVCDTPPSAEKGKDLVCTFNARGCPVGIDSIAVQKENYMDEWPEPCRNIFTQGQSARIDYFLENDTTLSQVPASDRVTSSDFLIFSFHGPEIPYAYVSSSRIVSVASEPYAPMIVEGEMELRSRTCVKLQSGFRANANSSLHVLIDTSLPEPPPTFKSTVKSKPQPRRLRAVAQAKIESNYPNPFTSSTRIPLTVKEDGAVSLDVCDISGNRVQTLYAGYLGVGDHTFEFVPGDLPAGHYYCRLSSGSFVQTVGMSYIR